VETYHKPVQLRGGFTMQLTDSSCPISRTLFNGDSWEPEVERPILRYANPDWLFLELGAHIGAFTLLAARHYGQVIAVEPHPASFTLLEKNVKLNELTNVELHHAAVSDHDGLTALRLAEGNTGSTFTEDKGGNYHVIALRPQTILQDRQPDIIKMDIEGDEYKVLMACPELLEAKVIVFEYSPQQLKRQGGRDVLDLFRDAGFRFPRPESRSYQNVVARRRI